MPSKKPVINIYTDGACKNNPGPGGYAALITLEKNGKLHEKVVKGRKAETTNNRMEMTAVIKALKSLKVPCEVTLYSDSQYVVKGMTEWSKNWVKNGWKNSARKAVENKDLWEKLLALNEIHAVKWRWVKAHAGHLENERVDTLARKEAEKLS